MNRDAAPAASTISSINHQQHQPPAASRENVFYTKEPRILTVSPLIITTTVKNFTAMLQVEEKLGEQNFRVFSEMQEKNLYTDPKNENFETKFDENADTDSAKI